MNLLFSYGAKTDEEYAALGHTFLGAGDDAKGSEVHVFLKKGDALASQEAKPTAQCAVPCVRLRKPFERDRGALPVPEPFTQAELDKRMDEICGCQGRHDCQCVSVFNQARSELWYEHNSGEKRA